MRRRLGLVLGALLVLSGCAADGSDGSAPASVNLDEIPEVGPAPSATDPTAIARLSDGDPFVAGAVTYLHSLLDQLRPGSTITDVAAAYRGRKGAFACPDMTPPEEVILVVYVRGQFVDSRGGPPSDLLMNFIGAKGGGFKVAEATPERIADPLAWCQEPAP